MSAARALLTSRDPGGVSIQEITDAADLGFGSFYNHFTSKQELFEVAVEPNHHRHPPVRAWSGRHLPWSKRAPGERKYAAPARTGLLLERMTIPAKKWGTA